jgi:hypothetical protein
MIDFNNKKILIRLDHTESTKGKNIVIDISAAPRMIKPKNSEVGVQKVDERKGKSGPRPKPTVKQMLANILCARPTVCLVGLEILSVLGPLLDPGACMLATKFVYEMTLFSNGPDKLGLCNSYVSSVYFAWF